MKPSAVPLRIGTRSSALALWQTERIRERLRAHGWETERVELKTTGDLAPEVPLSRLGSRAIFTKQIDDALIEGRIDLAVHSLKDLPTQLPAQIAIAAIAYREDPRDALVGRGAIGFDDLEEGALVATSSLRRRAQLLHLRPDIKVVELRGNVDTRLSKLDSHPEWAAIVLASAGLVRLGLEHRIGERLSPALMLPAPGQGALAVTVRSEDSAVGKIVREALHEPGTATAVAAERAFLRQLEGGCQVPVAAYAEMTPGEAGIVLRLHGRVIALDGETMVEGREVGSVPDEKSAELLGIRLADRLLAEGAGEILTDVRAASAPGVPEP